MLIAGFDDTAARIRDRPAPIAGVLFDFSNTLFHAVPTAQWLRAVLPAGSDAERLTAELATAWRHSEVEAAQRGRDLSGEQHASAVLSWVRAVPELAPYATRLNAALRAPDSWIPYADTEPVLRALHERGVPTGVISNIGWDIRGYFTRLGLAVDAFALSYEHGVAKPDPKLYQVACDGLGLSAEQLLMVGDTPEHDGGAARLGMRAYVLPSGAELAEYRGLDAVLALAGDAGS